jgi:hypothetical protein
MLDRLPLGGCIDDDSQVGEARGLTNALNGANPSHLLYPARRVRVVLHMLVCQWPLPIASSPTSCSVSFATWKATGNWEHGCSVIIAWLHSHATGTRTNLLDTVCPSYNNPPLRCNLQISQCINPNTPKTRGVVLRHETQTFQLQDE